MMRTKQIVMLSLACMTLFFACQENIEQRASREAKEFTRKNCPTPVLNNTRTDSLVYETANHTLHYYYTLVGPADNAEAFIGRQEELKSALVSAFRSNTGIRRYLEAGISLKLTYRSEKNPQQLLYETTLTAGEIISD